MEKAVASALEYLRGESRSEPVREIDVRAVPATECNEIEEVGKKAGFTGEPGVHFSCRSDALARAVRNLIEDANKYGNGASVGVRAGHDFIDISVSDTGPGVPENKVNEALKPFRRQSVARESQLVCSACEWPLSRPSPRETMACSFCWPSRHRSWQRQYACRGWRVTNGLPVNRAHYGGCGCAARNTSDIGGVSAPRDWLTELARWKRPDVLYCVAEFPAGEDENPGRYHM